MNNTDLISRNALLAGINSDREAAKAHPQEICERFNRFCDYAEVLVEQAPAVDAEPVRHGRWILNKHYGDYECSVCGEGNFRAWDFREHTMNYCPNCGAKMDAEVEG